VSKLQQRKYCFIWLLITIHVFIGFTGNSTNNYVSLSGNIANASNSESLQLHTLAKAKSLMLDKALYATLNVNNGLILVNIL